MKIRFYNARILSMNYGFDIIKGELATEDDSISYIGEKAPADSYDREIDCGGNLLMPGFKNAHTHSAMTFLRSYADDLPLQEWLYDKVFPMEAKLDGESVYRFSKLAVLEYLTSGITANFDMYYEPEHIAKASLDMGFRTVLCGAVNNFKESLEKLESYYIRFNTCGTLISYQLGFHAEYTTSKELMEGIAALAEKYKAPVFMHNSETAKEVAECKERYGLTPTELFDKIGLFRYGGAGFHSVYMTERDLEIYRKNGVYAVTNPASNAKLASGIAPVCRMLEKGIGVAIGTDGPASNNCLDMFREMFLVTGLQKIAEKDAAACSAEDVLYMATVGGARAMGLADCDVLAKGKKADIILIDLMQPNMQPLNNIVKNIVYSGSKINVKMTMVNGRILYENGIFNVGESVENIYRAVDERLKIFKEG
ncbi:MAG: amidohydrolase family protein [Ruminiclostridium sp.]